MIKLTIIDHGQSWDEIRHNAHQPRLSTPWSSHRVKVRL
jgi:hypothetical protein